jgi:hypothetical protein
MLPTGVADEDPPPGLVSPGTVTVVVALAVPEDETC